MVVLPKPPFSAGWPWFSGSDLRLWWKRLYPPQDPSRLRARVFGDPLKQPDMLSHTDHNAAIFQASRVGRVIGQRSVFTVTDCGQAFWCHPRRAQLLRNRCRPRGLQMPIRHKAPAVQGHVVCVTLNAHRFAKVGNHARDFAQRR